jgi:ornithine carbamoyltransferase
MTDINHFLDLDQFDKATLDSILNQARAMKELRRNQPKGAREAGEPLKGKALALIFERPSTRTRVSFEMAMRQLGGDVIMLTASEMQLGRSESIADTARVLSRYVDGIMIRAATHNTLVELAQHATVPVINGLTSETHPCQVMADILTLQEHKGPIADQRVAWIGDCNNVAASWMHAAGIFGGQLIVGSPPDLEIPQSLRDWMKQHPQHITMVKSAEEAARDADCIITDTWVSMHHNDGGRRHNLLQPYQVNARIMKLARPDAAFMHCLPAHRGEEVTDDVIDSPQSLVFDEAENRLHVQKSILLHCLGGLR